MGEIKNIIKFEGYKESKEFVKTIKTTTRDNNYIKRIDYNYEELETSLSSGYNLFLLLFGVVTV